jgi:hypothetical protein
MQEVGWGGTIRVFIFVIEKKAIKENISMEDRRI